MDALQQYGRFWGVLAVAITGLCIMGQGEVFGALREIALNTRAMAKGAAAVPEAPQAGDAKAPTPTTYGALDAMAGLLKLVGAVLIGGAIYVHLFVPEQPRPRAVGATTETAPPSP